MNSTQPIKFPEPTDPIFDRSSKLADEEIARYENGEIPQSECEERVANIFSDLRRSIRLKHAEDYANDLLIQIRAIEKDGASKLEEGYRQGLYGRKEYIRALGRITATKYRRFESEVTKMMKLYELTELECLQAITNVLLDGTARPFASNN